MGSCVSEGSWGEVLGELSCEGVSSDKVSQDRSHPIAGELLAIDDLPGELVFFRDAKHERLLMVQ